MKKRERNKTKRFILIWLWNLARIQFSWKPQDQFSQDEEIMKILLLSLKNISLRNVLFKIIAVVKTFAKNNLVLHGTNERIYKENNEFFLSIIEMIAKFDPIMQ